MKNLSKTLFIILLVMASSYQLSAQNQPLGDQFIVQVSLNNQTVWALLDPSTDFTIINSKEKASLDFKVFSNAYKNHLVEVGNNNYPFEVVGGAAIKFADISLIGAKLSCDLSDFIEDLEETSGKRISLIIGKNMMKHHGFILDLGKNTVTVTKPITGDSMSLEQSYSLIK